MAGFGTLAPQQAGMSEGYPVYQGGLPDPDWVKNLPPQYADLRRSSNIEDRRGDSWLTNWGGALLAGMAQQLPSTQELQAVFSHPLTRMQPQMTPSMQQFENNELSRQLGIDQIGSFGSLVHSGR